MRKLSTAQITGISAGIIIIVLIAITAILSNSVKENKVILIDSVQLVQPDSLTTPEIKTKRPKRPKIKQPQRNQPIQRQHLDEPANSQ